MVHDSPLGLTWHIEGPGVTEMLCGLKISVDDGEVRDVEPRHVCEECLDVS